MSKFDEIQTQFAVIERDQLARLKRLATELYREDRLNGDQMRDMGHTITGVLDSALPFEESKPEAPRTGVADAVDTARSLLAGRLDRGDLRADDLDAMAKALVNLHDAREAVLENAPAVVELAAEISILQRAATHGEGAALANAVLAMRQGLFAVVNDAAPRAKGAPAPVSPPTDAELDHDAMRRDLRSAVRAHNQAKIAGLGAEATLLLVDAVDRLTDTVDKHGHKVAVAVDYISDHLPGDR